MRLSRLQARCSFLQGSVDRGCLALFITITLLLLYQRFWQERNDPHKCDALLTRGRWLDAYRGQNSARAYQNWQPPGCMMHEYLAKDLTLCMKSRKLLFIGDSMIRQIFWATANKLGIQEHGAEKHADITVGAYGVRVEFVWDPYLNTSKLYQEVAATSPSATGNDEIDAATTLLVGGGLWNARYLGEASYQQYEDSLQNIIDAMGLRNGSTISESSSTSNNSHISTDNLVVIAPIQIPLYGALSPERAKTITPDRVKPMIQHLRRVASRENVAVAWSFHQMTLHEPSTYDQDGLHVDAAVAARMADVLLNLRCNDVLRRNNAKGYPMDKTCCNSYGRPNWAQYVILNCSLGFPPALVLITFKDAKRSNFLSSRKIARAVTVLALAMCFCYYADRTQLFNKAQKQYSSTEFLWLNTTVFVLGIMSLCRCGVEVSQKTSLSLHPKPLDQPFLSRHQTDEWKGWMQVIILVYHYTGASKVLAIYEFVRLLVASYIFMTGFGHTVYFYRKSDYSLRRCAAVLIRLNMLSCVLPYIMKTDYMFYYFAPLISFWYVVIFLTMAAGHSRNDSLAFLLVKIFIAASLTSTLIMVPGMFELVFEILQKCCNIHWNVEEWRFRLQLDSYIVYIGMFCGIGFVRITDALRAEHLEDGTLGDLICQLFWLLSILARAIACVVPPIYYLFGRQAPNKYAYNEWVPYVSAAPILSFVIFRNISRRTRNSHSSIFAWIGRHSLETFTLQFHIWLAADTKGLLALGVLDTLAGGARGGRVADLLVLTVIFFWVCWHVGAAIQTLTSWIIDPSEGREDLVVDESVNIVEERFPGTKSREDLRPLGHISRIAGRVGAEAIRSAIRSKRFVAGDLRVRLGVILGIMWMLNVTYPKP